MAIDFTPFGVKHKTLRYVRVELLTPTFQKLAPQRRTSRARRCAAPSPSAASPAISQGAGCAYYEHKSTAELVVVAFCDFDALFT